MTPTHPQPEQRDDRRGQRGTATLELTVVALGLLVFVAGLIGIGRLTDARTALAGVARQAARAAADASTASQAVRLGQAEAQQTASGYGLDPARLQVSVDPRGFTRGGTLLVAVQYRVRLGDLPTLRLLPGEVTLTAHQLEPIDPFTSRAGP
jgi:Flp pilus assembly protein TadG